MTLYKAVNGFVTLKQRTNGVYSLQLLLTVITAWKSGVQTLLISLPEPTVSFNAAIEVAV